MVLLRVASPNDRSVSAWPPPCCNVTWPDRLNLPSYDFTILDNHCAPATGRLNGTPPGSPDCAPDRAGGCERAGTKPYRPAEGDGPLRHLVVQSPPHFLLPTERASTPTVMISPKRPGSGPGEPGPDPGIRAAATSLLVHTQLTVETAPHRLSFPHDPPLITTLSTTVAPSVATGVRSLMWT